MRNDMRALIRAFRRGGRPPRRYPEWLTALLFLSPALLSLALFRLYPAVKSAMDSLTVSPEANTGFAGLSNYRYLFGSNGFHQAVTATIKIVAIAVAVQTVSALALAALLNVRSWGTAAWRTLIVVPIAVPLAVSSVVFGIAYRPDGPLNALVVAFGLSKQPFLGSDVQAPLALVVALSWVGVGYWMVFLIAGLQDIPKQLTEAAAVDGAGATRTFFSITLPLLRRPLAFVIVANTVANVLVFAPSQILTQGGPAGSTRVVMYDIYTRAFTLGDTGAASAEIVLLLIVMLALVGAQLRLLGGWGR